MYQDAIVQSWRKQGAVARVFLLTFGFFLVSLACRWAATADIIADVATPIGTPVSHTVPLPRRLAQTPADALREEDSEDAPSPLWLIVMPAIPLVGGGLIYAKRRLLTSEHTKP